MSYEVDVLAVGKETRSGDAMVFRYGDFTRPGGFRVVVFDGGFQDSGEELVAHIRRWYGTNVVDLQILSHPDADHVNGSHAVLEQMEVRELWMHQPWERAAEVCNVSAGNRTQRAVSQRLKASIDGAYKLEKLAKQKGVPIAEPFQGLMTADQCLAVLGPSEAYYNSLAAEFIDGKPAATAFSFAGILGQVEAGIRKVANIIKEQWNQDALTEPGPNDVTPMNNSSVILLAQLDTDCFLFTGDAGVPALTQAADFAEGRGVVLRDCLRYFQGPHHGSKRNVGPSLLNRIVGPIVPQGTTIQKSAFISAAKGDNAKHPSMRVTNALNRRGATVTATQGVGHCFRSLDVPQRLGWVPITPVQFTAEYDDGE